jgi:hypothetical protein
MAKPYEIFSGEELKIAEKIQRRRYQMLVHSYIYYEMNENIISDSQWSKWAVELAELQAKYPNIAKQVIYADDFEGWDGSSGAFLTYANKPNIINTANRLVRLHTQPKISTPQVQKSLINKTSTAKKKLF